jgi:hypothetical protein
VDERHHAAGSPAVQHRVEDLGDGRSSYRTTDVFTGDIAQVVFDLQGEWVTAGFNATAHALKARAEQLWRQR